MSSSIQIEKFRFTEIYKLDCETFKYLLANFNNIYNLYKHSLNISLDGISLNSLPSGINFDKLLNEVNRVIKILNSLYNNDDTYLQLRNDIINDNLTKYSKNKQNLIKFLKKCELLITKSYKSYKSYNTILSPSKRSPVSILTRSKSLFTGQ